MTQLKNVLKQLKNHMKLKVFKEIVVRLKEQDEILDKTYKAGIDLTNLLEPVQVAISHLILLLFFRTTIPSKPLVHMAKV